jgi:hypothetical protein
VVPRSHHRVARNCQGGLAILQRLGCARPVDGLRSPRRLLSRFALPTSVRDLMHSGPPALEVQRSRDAMGPSSRAPRGPCGPAALTFLASGGQQQVPGLRGGPPSPRSRARRSRSSLAPSARSSARCARSSLACPRPAPAPGSAANCRCHGTCAGGRGRCAPRGATGGPMVGTRTEKRMRRWQRT